MPVHPEQRTRRSLLTAGLGAVGVAVASMLGRTAPVRAEGEAIVVGGEYSSVQSRTYLKNQVGTNAPDDVFVAVTTGYGKGLWGKSDGGGIGVMGQASTTGYGVQGVSPSGIGVHGSSVYNHGVMGHSDASNAKAGVYGTGVTGVLGEAEGQDGRGVLGRSQNGRALMGQSSDGYGLHVNGRTHLSTSGVASMRAGTTSVNVTGMPVSATSFVLLTPMANLGTRSLWFTLNPASDLFTIRLSSARPAATKVAWLLLDQGNDPD